MRIQPLNFLVIQIFKQLSARLVNKMPTPYLELWQQIYYSISSEHHSCVNNVKMMAETQQSSLHARFHCDVSRPGDRNTISTM